MMGEEGVGETLVNASEGAGISVIEGAMGLYDGIDGTDLASTAQVAKILGAPVILVIDAKGMSRSVHAQIKGFRDFDPDLKIAGVIFNRLGTPRHREMIESSLRITSFGWIPRREDIATRSRHLGLMMGSETGTMKEFGRVVEEFCDVPSIIASAMDAGEMTEVSRKRGSCHAGPKIGIGLDDAFCFYYQDNFDQIRRCGAEIVFFSPISNPLPDVHAVYLGGGYPELHLTELASSPCTRMLKKAAEEGMPVYGECGGLLYLTESINYGNCFRMCGILPASAYMTGRVQALGYVLGKSNGKDQTTFSRGISIRGHEFHYSRVEPDCDARFAFTLSRGKGIRNGKDWLVSGNAVGAYSHAYFSRKFAQSFVESARQFAGGGES